MKVSATQLANNSKAVVDRVVQRGELAEIQRHGKTVAEIRRKVAVDRQELARILRKIRFSRSEISELKQAMNAASGLFGDPGHDCRSG